MGGGKEIMTGVLADHGGPAEDNCLGRKRTTTSSQRSWATAWATAMRERSTAAMATAATALVSASMFGVACEVVGESKFLFMEFHVELARTAYDFEQDVVEQTKFGRINDIMICQYAYYIE